MNVRSDVGADIVADVKSMPRVRSGSVQEVYLENVPYTAFTGANIDAIRELGRVAAPGGQLVISTGSYAKGEMGGLSKALQEAGFVDVQAGVRDGRWLITATKAPQ